jgi:hypothetical protein
MSNPIVKLSAVSAPWGGQGRGSDMRYLSQVMIFSVVFLTTICMCIPAHNGFSQSTTTPGGHNIHVGQWIKYGPLNIDIKSDNNYLGLIAKAMLSRGIPAFSASFPDENVSLSDIEWTLANTTNIEGNQVTTSLTMKPKFSQNISTNYLTVQLGSKNIISPFNLYLTKNTKVGDSFNLDFNGQRIPMYVNRTIDKNIGGHSVSLLELSGTKNSLNETNGFATENQITLLVDRELGRTLEINVKLQAGNILGVVTIDVKMSAIGWST